MWGATTLSGAKLHGDYSLGAGIRLDGETAFLLSGDSRLSDFDPARAAFFDLETTGLLGGSGNLAFLSGIARISRDGSVTMNQIMIRHPGEEPAALDILGELLADVDFLVSFNGKSFDRNVLADRFVMNRLCPDRVLELPHLDLLHPCRRLYRGVLTRCSLSAIEDGVLGVHRHESEICGSEVPERWFQFLRTDRFDLLAPVVEHNLLDVLSLITLGGHLARCVESPSLAVTQARTQVALGRLLLERGKQERGEELLRLLSRGEATDPIVYASLSLLAEHLRKSHRHVEARILWGRMIDAAGVSDLRPWIGTAIALEHRLGDPRAALSLIEQLLLRLDQQGDEFAEVPALLHRRQRLQRKLGAVN